MKYPTPTVPQIKEANRKLALNISTDQTLAPDWEFSVLIAGVLTQKRKAPPFLMGLHTRNKSLFTVIAVNQVID
jgi:hypothetical protein